jgi:hypothetical protein
MNLYEFVISKYLEQISDEEVFLIWVRCIFE